MMKWVPSEMTDIAHRAVANLLDVSTLAQKIVAWYTENPKQLYFHEGALHLKGKEMLSTREVALILWGDSGLLCQDAMGLIRVNEMHATRATFLCMFSCFDHGIITNAFERFKYTEDDESPIELRSHSLRHYLNMLAQTGGLSSAEIAIFSGRKDVKQSRAYDHMTSLEAQAPISHALKDGFTSELEQVVSNERTLVARSDFRGLGLAAAHTTEYGWCLHDFAS